MRFGVLREGKMPPDRRVPLTPAQCVELQARFPSVSVVVQPSPIRCFSDAEYRAAGVELREDLSDCDVLWGVKEVPTGQLLPDKTYFFFSHTWKQQPYNAKLLRACLDKRVRLIDYELLKRSPVDRIIGFGRFAGVVGTYNAFRTHGARTGAYSLPRAVDCLDRAEMERHLLANLHLAPNTKIALTGHGRVGNGAREIFQALGMREVSPGEYLRRDDFEEPVFTHLELSDYFQRRGGGGFNFTEFISDPSEYESKFLRFARATDIYVAGHFWGKGSPFVFTRADVRDPAWRVAVVADITCDIDGPVACTVAPSSIDDPMYGYDPVGECRVAFGTPGSVAVTAVDNLPCELPRDASTDFGGNLLEFVVPLVVAEGGKGDEAVGGGAEDKAGILEGATETGLDGRLTPRYTYLAEYAGVAEAGTGTAGNDSMTARL